MNLKDKLAALRSDFEAGRFALVPSAAQIETMERATNELSASGQAARALKLDDADGNLVRLHDSSAEKSAALIQKPVLQSRI